MDTLERVSRIISRELEMPIEEIRPEHAIQRDLGADSLAVMQIAMGVEEEFDIAIEDNELDSLVRIADVVKAVERKLQTGAASPAIQV